MSIVCAMFEQELDIAMRWRNHVLYFAFARQLMLALARGGSLLKISPIGQTEAARNNASFN